MNQRGKNMWMMSLFNWVDTRREDKSEIGTMEILVVRETEWEKFEVYTLMRETRKYNEIS